MQKQSEPLTDIGILDRRRIFCDNKPVIRNKSLLMVERYRYHEHYNEGTSDQFKFSDTDFILSLCISDFGSNPRFQPIS